MQFLFDVMIYWIQEGDAGNLDHLGSWIVSGLASVLISQYSARHPRGVGIRVAADLMFHVFVTHVEIITMYIDLNGPSVRTVVAEIIPQIFLNQLSRKICALSGLAGAI